MTLIGAGTALASFTAPTCRPTFMPYGLFGFSARVAPRSSIEVRIELPESAREDLTWWKYSNAGGWEEHRNLVRFNAARDVVTISLTDNGKGDDDPVLGVIRDPGGLAPKSITQTSNSSATPAESSGGGSAGPYPLAILLLYAFALVSRSNRYRGLHK